MKIAVLLLSVTGALMVQGTNPSIPGWRVNPELLAKSRFTYALDHEVTHAGRSSFHILPKAGADSGEAKLIVIQNVKAERYRGKRIRLSGYLWAAGDASVNIWLRVDDAELRMLDLANNMSSEQAKANVVRGSSEWKLVEQVVEVPQDGHGLAFGFMCTGLGEVWADDLQLEVVNQDVPLTSFGLAVTRDLISQQPPPSEETKKALVALPNIYKTAPEEPRNLNFEEVVQ